MFCVTLLRKLNLETVNRKEKNGDIISMFVKDIAPRRRTIEKQLSFIIYVSNTTLKEMCTSDFMKSGLR